MSDAPVRPTRTHLIILAFIIAVAACLRAYHLTEPSLWFDEDVSVVTATGHWESIFFPPNGYYEHSPDLASPTSLRPLHELFGEAESHPWFYSFCLRGWWAIFGMGDGSSRSLSVVLSTLALLFVFDIGRLISTPSTGLWAAAILAVAPTQIQYAQELRNYGLLVLESAVICDLVLRIYRCGPSRGLWIALPIVLFFSLETHYFILGPIALLAPFAWLKLKGRARWILTGIVVAAILSLIAIRAPVMLNHRMEMAAQSRALVDDPKDQKLNTVIRMASVPIWLILAPRTVARASGMGAIILLILPFLLEKRRPGMLLLGLWACGVIGLVAASDLILEHRALLNIRYGLPAAPALAVTIAVLGEIGGKWLRHGLPALTVIGAALGVPNVYADQLWEKPQARQWAEEIKSHVQPGDVLVLASAESGGLYRAGLEYLQLSNYAYPLPCPIAIVEGSASPELREQIWSHKRVWVAICHYAIDPKVVLGPCQVTHEGHHWLYAGWLDSVERTPSTTQAAR